MSPDLDGRATGDTPSPTTGAADPIALRNSIRDLCTLTLGSAADAVQDQKDGLARAILDAIGRDLDAPTTGAGPERVERWARTLDPALWAKVDGESSVLDPATIEYGRIASLARARAAIAFAEAQAALSTSAAAAGTVSEDDRLTPDQAWDNLINKDDRNSPEEYPEMAMLTFEELSDYMRRAAPSQAAGTGAGAVPAGVTIPTHLACKLLASLRPDLTPGQRHAADVFKRATNEALMDESIAPAAAPAHEPRAGRPDLDGPHKIPGDKEHMLALAIHLAREGDFAMLDRFAAEIRSATGGPEFDRTRALFEQVREAAVALAKLAPESEKTRAAISTSGRACGALSAIIKAQEEDIAALRSSTGAADAVAGIYMASKAVHGPRWRELRDAGWPIISTWIDEAEGGRTTDWADLWDRCAGEPARAAVTVLYAEEGEELKGALAEVGAALSHGRKVIVVGPVAHTWTKHRNVYRAADLTEARELWMPWLVEARARLARGRQEG